MTHPADIIIELASDNSRNFKEEVLLREIDNKELFQGFQLGLDSFGTFGIKQVPEKISDSEHQLSFYDFCETLKLFQNRELTGNAAKQKVHEMMDSSSAHIWNNWYRLILIKDFRCGVSEKTINKCLKKAKKLEHTIPVFSCQLASPIDDHRSKLKGDKLVDVKLDGTRLLTIVYPNGNVVMFTRNGKEVSNFPDIKEQFMEYSGRINEAMVFDGELVSKSFQDLMTMFFRKTSVDTSDSCLYLFDAIPLNAFVHGKYDRKQLNRREWLNDFIGEGTKNIKALDYYVLDFSNTYDMEQFRNLNLKALENGYEGIMIKDCNAPYECKRGSHWLKQKPVVSFDLEILDVEEGTGKYVGMMGAIYCHGFENDKEIFVSVGSGFSDELRVQYWNNRDDLIDKIVEIECDAITKNQDGGYSLRFPRFKRLRGFDIAEKL